MAQRLALSGYMGSGKTVVARVLTQKGFAVIDADREAKRFMEADEVLKATFADVYGPLSVEGGIIRYDRIGATVFATAANLIRHNDLVRPCVTLGISSLLRDTTGDVVVDGALIPFWNMDHAFDRRLWIDASSATRIDRVTRRGLELHTSRSRVAMQEGLFSLPQNGWIHLVNDGSLDALERVVEQFLSETSYPVT